MMTYLIKKRRAKLAEQSMMEGKNDAVVTEDGPQSKPNLAHAAQVDPELTKGTKDNIANSSDSQRNLLPEGNHSAPGFDFHRAD